MFGWRYNSALLLAAKARVNIAAPIFVGYGDNDTFDWLAIVILPGKGCDTRRIFVVSRKLAPQPSYVAKYRNGRGFFVHKLVDAPPSPLPKRLPTSGLSLADYENNFRLA